jgi:hypothetical protein
MTLNDEGEVVPPNTVADARAAWQQIDAQRSHQAELLAMEEATIMGGLVMLGRWRQSRQQIDPRREQLAVERAMRLQSTVRFVLGCAAVSA